MSFVISKWFALRHLIRFLHPETSYVTVFSLLSKPPYLVLFHFLVQLNTKYSPYHGVCFTDWSNENKGFRITFYIYTIGICYIAILFSYTRIYMKIRAHNSTTMASLDSARSMTHFKGNKACQKSNDACSSVGKKGTYRVNNEENNLKITSDFSSHSSKINSFRREIIGAPLEDNGQDGDRVNCDGDGSLNDDVINDDDAVNNDDVINDDDVSVDDVKDGDVNDDDVDDGDVDVHDVHFDTMNHDGIGVEEGSPTSKKGRIKTVRSTERLAVCLNNAVRKIKSKSRKSEKDIRASRLFQNELKVTKIMFSYCRCIYSLLGSCICHQRIHVCTA